MRDLLESVHPNGIRRVENCLIYVSHMSDRRVLVPPIRLYCDNDNCSQYMFFDEDEHDRHFLLNKLHHYLSYRCRNCKETQKVYSLLVFPEDGSTNYTADVLKVGEAPPFGPHTPSRLSTLLGPDRDLFFKGRRAESQGLGIGAFAYYRRIVENQRDRFLLEIEKVARKTNVPDSSIEAIVRARKENQFSTSVEIIKDAIPPGLLLEGQNPLKLLHSALSEGIHAMTDEDCLQYATSIRVVLAELSERIGITLEDHRGLHEAVTLLSRRSEKRAPN